MAKKQDFPEDRAPGSARKRPNEPTEADNIRLKEGQRKRIENDIDSEGTAAGGSSGSSSSRDHSDNKPDRPREGGGGGGSQSSKHTP